MLIINFFPSPFEFKQKFNRRKIRQDLYLTFAETF